MVLLFSLIAVISFGKTKKDYSLDTTSSEYYKLSLGLENGIGNTQMIDFKIRSYQYNEFKQWLQNIGVKDTEMCLWDKISFGARSIKYELKYRTSLEYIQSEDNSIVYYGDGSFYLTYYIKAQNGFGNYITSMVSGSIKYKNGQWDVGFYIHNN